MKIESITENERIEFNQCLLNLSNEVDRLSTVLYQIQEYAYELQEAGVAVDMDKENFDDIVDACMTVERLKELVDLLNKQVVNLEEIEEEKELE